MQGTEEGEIDFTWEGGYLKQLHRGGDVKLSSRGYGESSCFCREQNLSQGIKSLEC